MITMALYVCNWLFIKQDFSSSEPLKKMLTDITQIQCYDGKLYISPILDCCNGEILSLIMRDNMKNELCIDTFKALAIFHSDRGSQTPVILLEMSLQRQVYSRA